MYCQAVDKAIAKVALHAVKSKRIFKNIFFFYKKFLYVLLIEQLTSNLLMGMMHLFMHRIKNVSTLYQNLLLHF